MAKRVSKKRKSVKGFLGVLAGIVCALVIIFAVYLNIYYHGDVNVQDYQAGAENIYGLSQQDVYEMGTDIGERKMTKGLWIQNPDTANENLIIFYPGAKVEHTAYLPMFYELAEHGVDVYIVEMPGKLAFFGMEKAASIMSTYQYDNYYLAGHSLGGAMGASFAADYIQNSDQLKGMIFLAAYPTASLNKDGFKTLSIYGSEDLVLSMDKVEAGRQYMPEDYTEVCIDGGNHAQFGDYGLQKGDGTAKISREEQQDQTVELILEFIKK